MGKEIFISYSRHDKTLVFPLVELINQELGTQCWIDLKGIESGEEFEEVIMNAIEKCKVVLFMLSDNSLKSRWTKREVYYAESEGKRIIPILIDGNNLRGWFKFHFGNVDFINIQSYNHKEKLISNLKSWLGVKTGPILSSISAIQTTMQKEALTTPKEQCTIGGDYFYGRNGKARNFAEAVKWYRKAAEQGNADAQFNLGYCYLTGQGVSQDYTKAVMLYRKAAEQGLAHAQYSLGSCYEYGQGVLQDIHEATIWYWKAAKQKYADAKEALERLTK